VVILIYKTLRILNNCRVKTTTTTNNKNEQGLIKDTNTYKKIEALTKFNEEINNSSYIQSLKP
jgi:hypothetical protein